MSALGAGRTDLRFSADPAQTRRRPGAGPAGRVRADRSGPAPRPERVKPAATSA